MLHVTTLMDNIGSENQMLVNLHGLSFLVEYNGSRILFDTSSSPILLENAKRTNTNLHGLDYTVLSHNHWDHTAGFPYLVEQGINPGKLIIGDGFFDSKYALDGFKYTYLSGGFDQEYIEKHGIETITVQSRMQISEGLYAVSGFPRIHEIETVPKRFVKKTSKGIIPDNFEDEICLVIETSKGLVILLGCSHPGILNMLSHINNIFKQPIYGIFGGSHLMEADENRINTTINIIKEMNVHVIGLSHCSGQKVEDILKKSNDIICCHMQTGDELFLD